MKLVLRPLEPPYYTILYRPINRADKRKFTFETDKVVEHLFPIDAEFLTELFVHPDISYQSSYGRIQQKYRQVAQWLNRTGKFKYIKVDEDYFENEYKPLERECQQ
jgi:hypothetical protein